MFKGLTENASPSAATDSRALTGEELEELRAAEADVELKKRLHDNAVEAAPKDHLGRTNRFDPTLSRMSTEVMLARRNLRQTKDRIRGAWHRRQIPVELRD